ncbi:hypothetical protein HZS_5492 [Henneguya salminicola]|uniref:Large ribosomal subunit protein P2 n=1 Tax=Henneguya salminicola TaxID=69463 RepID=A0A6G3MLI6_HENSL|nr:hypothetical protein HZS_5492 [Henneguya salminicola]
MASAELLEGQKACVFASLIILDCKKEITSERLAKVLKSSKINIEPFWPKIFSNAVSGCNPESLLKMSVSAPVSQAAHVQETSKAAEVVEEKEDEPESDDDIGLGSMFD